MEVLEDRIAPAGFVFIDYGDNFPLVGGNRTMNTTIGGLRDVADSPVPNDKILGSVLTDSNNQSPTSTPVSVSRPAYTAAQRAQMRAVIQRAFSAIDVIVVELTQAAQALPDGRVVAAATGMADVVNTLRAGNAALRDAYVIAATFVVDPGGPTQRLYNNGGGISPGSPTLGVASDLATASNNHDDVALVYASGITGNFSNTMNNISHEAGHLLGLQHSITNPSTNAAINQFHQAEIMSYRNTNNTSSSMFTRYPMIRGDGNSPATGTNPVNYNDLGARGTPAGQPTYYNQLARDGNVLARPNLSFVSGTGANDIITIARSGSQATVTVQAFSTTTYTAASAITVPGFPGSTIYQYTIPLTQSILVFGGDGADRFVIDADLGVPVDIDGMLGTDTLVVNGKNAASLSYTPAATSPNGVDLLPVAGGMSNVVSFEGRLVAGGTVITFRDFETSSSVSVQDFGTVTFVTPNSADTLQLDSPATGQNRIAGNSGGVSLVPLLVSSIATLVVDAAANDAGGSGADSIIVGVASGPSVAMIINTGVGADSVTVNSLGAGFNVPLQVNAGAGADTFRLLNTSATYTPERTTHPDRGTLLGYGGKTIQFTGFEFVTPVAPALTSLGLDRPIIDAGGVVTLAGLFVDPGTRSSHSVTIDWGDGTSERFNLYVGARDFSFGHRYQDADPGDSADSNYSIRVTVTDNDNLADTEVTQVVVRNAAAGLSSFAATGDGPASLFGAFLDPGWVEGHVVIIASDDPANTVGSTFALPATYLLMVGQRFYSESDGAILEIIDIDPVTQVISYRVSNRDLFDAHQARSSVVASPEVAPGSPPDLIAAVEIVPDPATEPLALEVPPDPPAIDDQAAPVSDEWADESLPDPTSAPLDSGAVVLESGSGQPVDDRFHGAALFGDRRQQG